MSVIQFIRRYYIAYRIRLEQGRECQGNDASSIIDWYVQQGLEAHCHQMKPVYDQQKFLYGLDIPSGVIPMPPMSKLLIAAIITSQGTPSKAYYVEMYHRRLAIDVYFHQDAMAADEANEATKENWSKATDVALDLINEQLAQAVSSTPAFRQN